ncbi:MAG: hypothetical protein ACTHOH_17310 [Lysobacteraceae bacterium]
MIRLPRLSCAVIAFLASVPATVPVIADEPPKALYLGTTPEADRESVALAVVTPLPRDVARYDCQLDWIVGMYEGAHSRNFGDHSLLAMRPGTYKISAVYRSAGRDGFMFEEHRFEAGHTYRIACGGKTVRNVRISVREISDTAPNSAEERSTVDDATP